MRKIIHQFFTIVAIVFAGLLLADVAKACSCSYVSIDKQIKDAKDIVILELQSVTKYRKGEPQLATTGNIKYSTLVVKKVFKGNLKVGQRLKFAQGACCICVWAFEKKDVGEKYLFYLYPESFDNGLWYGSVCSRSTSLKSASSDLLYLEKLNKVKGQTRFTGEITKIIYSDKNEPSNLRLTGVEIKVGGDEKDITPKTNKDGIYKIYDLPIGKYKLIPQKIKGFGIKVPDRILPADEAIFEIEIKAKSLVEQDIEYLVN